jgi:hypothetical protein
MKEYERPRVRKEKPPAAHAGGGLGAAELLTPLNQAMHPALRLEDVIRISGMGAAPRMRGQHCAPVRRICMTLNPVEQSCEGASTGLHGRIAGRLFQCGLALPGLSAVRPAVRTAARVRPIFQVEGRIHQRNVRESLREVAHQPFFLCVVFLRQ